MNLLTKQVYGNKVVVGFNTEIGGVSATISSASLLATKLAISVGRIFNFTVVGSDIKCFITGGTYSLGDTFQSDANVTYYRDTDSLITSFGNNAFSYAINFAELVATGVTTITGERNFQNTKLTLLNFPNLTSAGITSFNEVSPNKSFTTQIYIPNCLTLGVNVNTNESVFFGITSGSIIYAHPSLATINSGGVEADLAYAITQGAIVRYVTNYTSPNPVTTLTAGTIYNTAIKLTFTPPTGSTNAIEYYECYANGVRKNNITASGQYITELTSNTVQTIVVYAVDIFLNKSVVSNTVSVSTTNNANDITYGLVSYYKLDETSGTVAYDSFGINNLTNTGSVSLNLSGKIGTCYGVTSAGKYLKCNYSKPIIDNFSLNFWIYRTGTATADNAVLYQVGSYGTNSGFGVWINLSNQITWVINQNYNHYSASLAIPLNTWTMATMTFDGANVKLYLDAVLKTTTAQTIKPNVSSFIQIFDDVGGRNSLSRQDENSVYSISLSQSEIDNLYNSGNGITL